MGGAQLRRDTMKLEIAISQRSAGIILVTATVFLCVKHFIDRDQGDGHLCILEQIEESNMKRLLDMTRAQPRRDTVALEIVHQCPEASTPGRSLFAAVILVFLPFGAGYILSYFFRTINALISGTLTSEFHFGAADLGLLTSVYFVSAFVQLPIGGLVDRYGPRRMQSVLLLMAAAGATLFATGLGFWTLLAGRALIGVGAGAAVIAGFK